MLMTLDVLGSLFVIDLCGPSLLFHQIFPRASQEFCMLLATAMPADLQTPTVWERKLA